MLRVIFFLALACSSFVNAGSLYTFDKNSTMIAILSHIQLSYPDLAKLGLTPKPLQPSFEEGKLVVSATFGYPAQNELGVLYACAKVNENGELINIQRDIPPVEGIANFPRPESFGCWGKP